MERNNDPVVPRNSKLLVSTKCLVHVLQLDGKSHEWRPEDEIWGTSKVFVMSSPARF